jgi:hypothetical protein
MQNGQRLYDWFEWIKRLAWVIGKHILVIIKVRNIEREEYCLKI